LQDSIYSVTSHVCLDDARHPIHGHFADKWVWVFQGGNQTLNQLIEIHFHGRAFIIKGVIIRHQKLGQHRLSESECRLSDLNIGVRNHGEYSTEEQVQEFKDRISQELFI
jgi:hypothetical protein